MELVKIIALTVLLIPVSAITLWLYGLISIGTLILLFVVLFIVFIIFPIIYRCSYSLQRNLLFLNFVSFPVDFKNPVKTGTLGSRNFYLESTNNVSIGVWQILPAIQLPSLLIYQAAKGQPPEELYDTWLGNGSPIFLYMHGNSGNRGAGHRVELYKVLQRINFHVIAFDYRSYGDSSQVEPSEEGVVADTKTVYRWVKSKAKGSKIFFWGHSLGTGISSRALAELEAEGERISGLVLESPFNNIRDELREYPLARIYHALPWFDFFFTEPMFNNGLRFQSDTHLAKVKAPILILHAEDDVVVPFKLGKKLYETLKCTRGDNQLIKFVPFEGKCRHGHKFIYRDQKLPDLIRSFVDESLDYKQL